jgi:hypothetical protein
MNSLSPTIAEAASDNIDWDLLLLLARVEASLTWPDMVTWSDMADGADPVESLPDGLDLRHGCDIDWVWRWAAMETPPSPLFSESTRRPRWRRNP